jgi:hypothetical protein
MLGLTSTDDDVKERKEYMVIGTFCPCNGSLVTSPGNNLLDYELLHLQVACKVRVRLFNASFMCKECGCMHTCGSTVCHIMSRDSSSCVF